MQRWAKWWTVKPSADHVEHLKELARVTQRATEKLVKARKEEIRGEILTGGITAMREHIADLNARLGKPYMPKVPTDFAEAIKSKRTVDSLRSAVNNELARAKIEASTIANRIQINLGKTLRELASAQAFLFARHRRAGAQAPRRFDHAGEVAHCRARSRRAGPAGRRSASALGQRNRRRPSARLKRKPVPRL